MNYWQSRNKEISDIVNPQKQIKKMYRDSYKRQREYINTLYSSLKSGNTLTRTELYQFSQFLKIKREIKKECNTNLARLTKEVESTLKKAYKETFGNTRYLGKKGSKKEWTVENIKRMESCLETAWSGEHFSKRLYKNTNKLARTIEEVIVDSVVNGKSKQECIRAIRERNDISYRQAETLWQTETSYVINKADLDTFQSDGCEEVEIMAELRERTCEHCRSKDGKKVKIKGAKIGVDIPPFHPRCHCDILPVVNWKSSENNTNSKTENTENPLTNNRKYAKITKKTKETPITFKELDLNAFENMKHSITKEERKILYGKTHFSGYINSSNARKMNEIMRIGEKLPSGYQKIADTLQAVIDKNVLNENLIVTRYVSGDALESIVGVKMPEATLKMKKEDFFAKIDELPFLINKGHTYTEKGFLSTSGVVDKNVMQDRPILLKIKAPKGTHCYVTTNKKESEIIFGQNTKVKILDLKIENSGKSNWKVVLDCIIDE